MNRSSERVVGVVGLGTMGGRIAGHLAQTGYTVAGFDPAESITAATGVERCGTLADLAGRAAVATFSLPDGATVLRCAAEVAATAGTTETVIDLSTIGVETAEKTHSLLADAGIGYVDSPVSGSLNAAASGGLSVMVSGEASVVDGVRDILDRIGVVSHLGERPGLGQAMKVINNAISGTTLAVTSEALALGCELGMDLSKMVEVINRSSGRSLASEVKIPEQVLSGAYAHGGPGSHFAKDIGLFVAAAREAGVAPRLAEAAALLWSEFAAAWPGADQTEIFPYLRGAPRPRKSE